MKRPNKRRSKTRTDSNATRLVFFRSSSHRLIAYGFYHVHGIAIKNWQLMYLVLGLITVVVSTILQLETRRGNPFVVQVRSDASSFLLSGVSSSDTGFPTLQ